MTDIDRQDYVRNKFFKCIKPITNVRYGRGCDVGDICMFEYIHDTCNGEHPNADAFYRKSSNLTLPDEVFITDDELRNNFVEC